MMARIRKHCRRRRLSSRTLSRRSSYLIDTARELKAPVDVA